MDKNHTFCKANLVAVLAAAILSPLFGLFNDWVGIRINSAIGMAALAIISIVMGQFELYKDFSKFWLLLAAHIFMNWQSTTINYGCSRLFGIKCGLLCLSYVKSATVVAACMILIPLFVYGQCFGNQNCEDVMYYLVGCLLLSGSLLSVFLNPKPLV